MDTEELIIRLKKLYHNAPLELQFRNAFELLVAVLLSAQARDVTINEMTPVLFEKYPTAEHIAHAAQEDLEKIIRKSGFYKRKANLLKKCCQALVENFQGKVPKDLEKLATLPGVGRKTAAMVIGNAYHENQGIAVDTHVLRVANRLGLVNEKNPEKTEQQLMNIFPQNSWTFLSNALILHGRRVCKAKKPECNSCGLNDICPKKI